MEHIQKYMKTDTDYIRAGVNEAGSMMLAYMERGEQPSMHSRRQRALDKIEEVFLAEHGYRYASRMSLSSRKMYAELIERIEPELMERLEGLPLKVKKMLMKRAVNKQTAEALITSYLSDSGLKYTLQMQTQRAVVRVELNKKKRATFYVYYKRMYDELEKLVPAVEALNGIIDSFSYFFKVH